MRLYHADHHIQPCARSHALAPASPVFRHLRGRRRKFSTSPVSGRCSTSDPDQDAGSSFILRSVATLAHQRQIKSSAIFTTGCPQKARQRGSIAYILQPVARLSVQRGWRAAATQDACTAAPGVVIISPLAEPSPTQPEPQTRTVAARSAATWPVAHPVQDCWRPGCFRPTPVDYKAYRLLEAGHENSPRR